MARVEYDKVIEAYMICSPSRTGPADRTDEALDVTVLPRASQGGRPIPDAHGAELFFEYCAVNWRGHQDRATPEHLIRPGRGSASPPHA